MGSKKGFFFTVLALILLTFMMVSVQMWAQEQSVRENRSAERFRAYGIRSALALTDEGALSQFSNTSLLYSLHFLSTKLSETPCSPPFVLYYTDGGRYPDGTYYVAQALAELMENGSTWAGPNSGVSPFYCGGLSSSNATFSPSETVYALRTYFAKTSQAASMLGYNLTWGKVKNLTVNQTGVWEVSASFTVDANISDKSGFSQNKTLRINSKTDINGLLDPFISGMDRQHRLVPSPSLMAKRQVFHVDNYTSRAQASANVAGTGLEGLGFFFGPVVNVRHDSSVWSMNMYQFNASKMSSYIFYTNDPQEAIEESAYFGGIILVADSGGFNPVGSMRQPVPGCFIQDMKQQNCVYCLQYEQRSGTCPGNANYFVDPATKLDAPVPYVNVPAASPFLSNLRANYHLGLPEALISNKANFTDSFGSGAPNWNGPNSNLKFSVAGNDSAVYDLTGPRDLAICGYYVPSANGPSFLKRFVNPSSWTKPNGHSFSDFGSGSIGIESVLLGSWAGGMNDPQATGSKLNVVSQSSEFNSRLDYQFYADQIGGSSSKCMGMFEKGMPGCKDINMCGPTSTDPATMSAGRFAFDNTTARGYGFPPLLNMTGMAGQIPSGCD